MERRNLRKHEPIEKKIDKKDRGDLKKINETSVKIKVVRDSNLKVVQPDAGDTVKAKADKRLNAPKKIMEMPKTEERPNTIKKKDIEVTPNRNVLPDDRRKTRDRYTPNKEPNEMCPTDVTIKETSKVVRKGTVRNVSVGTIDSEFSKIDRLVKKPMGAPKDKIITIQTSKEEADKESVPHRRPVIKTITSKSDSTKIYKAVTFMERSENKPTALKVKLPDEFITSKTSDISAAISKQTTGENIEDKKKVVLRKPKKAGRKKSKLKRLSESPESLVRGNSPPTEVAKWAPSSINKHTKPYYEAWVSTTLAAISKASKRDKLFLEKQHILETFQRALTRRPETPDLEYENINDERYTGRIKVRQR